MAHPLRPSFEALLEIAFNIAEILSTGRQIQRGQSRRCGE